MRRDSRPSAWRFHLRRSGAAAAVLLSAACATRPSPLPVTYSLGSSRATYRDYRGKSAQLCETEPRWLMEELVSVNGLLRRFLEETELASGEEWPEEKLRLLDEATQTLPEVLETHQWALAQLGRCEFGQSRALPSVRRRGLEYLALARLRLELAPAIADYLRAKSELAQWKEQRPRLEEAARERCSRLRGTGGSSALYFASEDEQAEKRWSFCDGTVVRSGPDGSPVVQPPLRMSRAAKRRFSERSYLEAASRLPPDAIHRAPRVPSPPSLDGQEHPQARR